MGGAQYHCCSSIDDGAADESTHDACISEQIAPAFPVLSTSESVSRQNSEALQEVQEAEAPVDETLVGRFLVLVEEDSPNRCILLNAEALRNRETDVELVLKSHPGLAIVHFCTQVWKDGEVVNIPLGIGQAESAMRASWDGRNVRNSEGMVLCPHYVQYHKGNGVVVGSGRSRLTCKEFLIGDDGTVYAVQQPHLVLGVEDPGVPVSGRWLSMKDELQSLTATNGVARMSDGFLASIQQYDDRVLLRYEWGETFWYRMDEDKNLVEPNRFVSWVWIPASARGKSVTILMDSQCEMRRGTRVGDLVESGAIALVRGSYIEECWKARQPLGMRQKIAAHHFWAGNESVDLWEKYGRMFFVILSYGWISESHPDPDCFHLYRLAGIVQKLRHNALSYGIADIGIVIDWCSLYQQGGAVDQRTESQRQDFDQGIRVFADMYVHKHVTALKLKCMPPHVTRGYDDRGWTLCESILIDSKAGLGNRLTFDEQYKPEDEMTEHYGFLHKFGNKLCEPPVTVEGFLKRLEARRKRTMAKGHKLFARHEDHVLVPELYRISFECVRRATTLSYQGSEFTDDDVFRLCEVLVLCHTLKLSLNKNNIGDISFVKLIETLVQVGSIRRLRMDYNAIGDAGADCLIENVSKMPTLVSLSINGNPFCQSPKQVEFLRDAWVRAGKDIRVLVV